MSVARRLLALRAVRFGIVASVCTAIQLALMLVLVARGIDSLSANGIGFVASSQANFVLSAVFTYRDRHITWSYKTIVTHWLPFNATALCALAVNEVVFALGVNNLGHLLASLCGTLSGACISFFVGNKAIFNPKGNSTVDTTQRDVDEAVVRLLQQEGIAFFLPAYNEAPNLPTVVGSIYRYFAEIGCYFTIFIVNDGSEDNTGQVAKDLEELYGHRRVVAIHQPNKGYGGALRTGITASLESQYGLIAFCDADNQFNIADCGALISKLIRDNADLSIGIRTMRADSLKRRLMGRGWHMLSSFLLGYKATDVDCGFKVFTRLMLEKIGPQLSGDYAVVSPEILIRAQRAGFAMTETSVEHKERTAGKQTGANLRVVLRSVRQVFQLRRTINQEG